MSLYYGMQAVLGLKSSLPLLSHRLLLLVVSGLNLSTVYFCLFTFSYIFMLMGTMAFTLLEAVRQLIKQLKGLLYQLRKSTIKFGILCPQEADFRLKYTRTVINICHMGRRFYSVATLTLLSVHCPSNALLTIILIRSSRPEDQFGPVVTILVVMVFIFQFTCIFILHSFLAELNGRLKKLPKRYYSFLNGENEKENRKTTLHIHFFLSAFHTNKPYGFTYSNVGHVSSLNYFKVSLVYNLIALNNCFL